MRYQDFRLGKTRGTRLDSVRVYALPQRHCKPQGHCRVFASRTGLDWTGLDWCLRTLSMPCKRNFFLLHLNLAYLIIV